MRPVTTVVSFDQLSIEPLPSSPSSPQSCSRGQRNDTAEGRGTKVGPSHACHVLPNSVLLTALAPTYLFGSLKSCPDLGVRWPLMRHLFAATPVPSTTAQCFALIYVLAIPLEDSFTVAWAIVLQDRPPLRILHVLMPEPMKATLFVTHPSGLRRLRTQCPSTGDQDRVLCVASVVHLHKGKSFRSQHLRGFIASPSGVP